MATPASRIVLRVDPVTARAYRNASDEAKARARERARSAFESALTDEREATRRQDAREFMAFMDETAREAEARGLTPEILQEILSEDPPGDLPPSSKAPQGGDGVA